MTRRPTQDEQLAHRIYRAALEIVACADIYPEAARLALNWIQEPREEAAREAAELRPDPSVAPSREAEIASKESGVWEALNLYLEANAPRVS